jgi:hypothetical protein
MSIYDPLTSHLKALDRDVWSASFADVERILRRSLPESAYQHRPWWANQKKGNHSQARAWQKAGWATRDVDLAGRKVVFERMKRPHPAEVANHVPVPPDDLFTKAARLTGIQDRGALVEAALEALIQREMVRQLAQLGGSMPDLVVPERERPFA